MNLEHAQQEMQARVARKRKKSSRKKARTRISIKTLLTMLAQHTKASGRVRAWAIQQLILLQGKPVQPFEELANDEEKPGIPEPTFKGADLGNPGSVRPPVPA